MYRQIKHKTIVDSGDFSLSRKTMSFIPENRYIWFQIYIKIYYNVS